MAKTHNLVLGIVRLSLVIILLGSMMGDVTPGVFEGHSVLAAKKDKKDKGGGNEGKGNENGKKEKKDKKDKKDKQNDEVTVIVAPDVTPIPAPVTPAATVSPELEQNGTLRIVARVCSARPAADADWETACGLPVTNAGFVMEALEGSFAGWHRDVEADDAGEVTVEHLPVGRYGLEQSHDDWCRAESDRVDANGDLVIERDQVTTVWIFNCMDAPLGS
jgi:hypothetical protein